MHVVHNYGAAGHAETTRYALWDVAVHGHFITEARDRLDTAVTSYGDEYARARVMSRIKLASRVMVTGDLGEAAMINGQALDAATTIRSRRVVDDMRTLSSFGEPHQRLAEIAELTHRVDSAVIV